LLAASDRLLLLVYNARIWQSSSGEDATWMTFDTVNGRIAAVGRHRPPLHQFPPDRRRDAGLSAMPTNSVAILLATGLLFCLVLITCCAVALAQC